MKRTEKELRSSKYIEAMEQILKKRSEEEIRRKTTLLKLIKRLDFFMKKTFLFSIS